METLCLRLSPALPVLAMVCQRGQEDVAEPFIVVNQPSSPPATHVKENLVCLVGGNSNPSGLQCISLVSELDLRSLDGEPDGWGSGATLPALLSGSGPFNFAQESMRDVTPKAPRRDP